MNIGQFFTINHIFSLVYLFALIFTIFRILLDTHSTSKTLAYLLLVIVLPILGMIIYYSVGINYRHKRHNHRAVSVQKDLDQDYFQVIPNNTNHLLEKYKEEFGHYEGLVKFQLNMMGEYLSENSFELLVNGEEKFPEVLKSLEQAEHFIHMEYYAWENDIRGNQIKEILINKSKAGLSIKVLYDDYASRGIHKNIVKELKENGVAIYPNIKVKLRQFANRLNHRDHRKVIIIDGKIGFLGGINISDRYDNSIDTGLYWRDTHVKFSGPLVHSLQRHFIVSWNMAQEKKIEFQKELFPESEQLDGVGTKGLAQLMAGGPVYPQSNIMMTYFKSFTIARRSLYITNPYFIPNEGILNSLKQAALSGVDVRILLPEKSDSAIVGAASKFYFAELLEAGVRIFLYKKGFIHAKTVVADQKISIIGTANMDIRSFDLNFELMSVIYGSEFGLKMENMFFKDLQESVEMTKEQFHNLSTFKKLTFATARLISSFL
ncbi:cardiolipin synthase [Algoriphagus halophilus]|uniref:Cardiolipin synthase n=1 Tax=Algoriphagus halophilus TaxID=226505 RepID=A0A1N6DUL6_9BACT|nr:cardiolipin synthase [Algoriphagus halophilus]SIN74486.1 cardiolipin synthase [Algoriphagus halophilus]